MDKKFKIEKSDFMLTRIMQHPVKSL